MRVAPGLTPIKQIRAGVLDVGYYEAGPDDGAPVLLLHGFPYFLDSYVPRQLRRRDRAPNAARRTSPYWHFDEATLARHASVFDKPYHVEVVNHSYRHRLGQAQGYPTDGEVERRLAVLPPITVPTITLALKSGGEGPKSPSPPDWTYPAVTALPHSGSCWRIPTRPAA